MNVSEDIVAGEELGRGVFSSRTARRAHRRVPHHIFLERAGETSISVDRLSAAPMDRAIEIADGIGEMRNRQFYGWAVVTSEDAASNGRRVVASPISDNPYHADILLPGIVAEDREEQKRHAQELADVARWHDRTQLQ